jgi:hypothetical protein
LISTIKGIPNDMNIPFQTIINSIVLLFSSLPSINTELPLSSGDELIGLFTLIVHYLHIDSIPMISIVGDGSVIHNTHKDWSLEELVEALKVKLTESIPPKTLFNDIYTTFMNHLILKTKFGDRFDIQPTLVPSTLPLDLTLLGQVEKTSLIEVLNSVFCLPSLFFGRPLLPRSAEYVKLTVLPHFLVFLFHRFDGTVLNTTTIEITMDMDMAKFLDPRSMKPTVSHGYRGSPTFYKLHGFITQKEGHYMTYSRIRSGKTWFRLQDSVVEKVELGASIESKGIVLALYRLQDY